MPTPYMVNNLLVPQLKEVIIMKEIGLIERFFLSSFYWKMQKEYNGVWKK
jgi:hypothetical protein